MDSIFYILLYNAVYYKSGFLILIKTAKNLSPLFLVTFFPSSELSYSLSTTGSFFCKQNLVK